MESGTNESSVEPPQAVQEVRMLTDDELVRASTGPGFPYSLVDLRIVQRLCAEVWGLKLAAISATTEPKQ